MLAAALLRWQRAAGPFWPYVCPAPFLTDLTPGPTVASVARLPSPLAEAVRRLSDGPAAIFVDLPPEPTLCCAPILNQHGLFAVPVLLRWATEPATVPSGQLVAALVGTAARVARPLDSRGVVFVLDGDRGERTPRSRQTYSPRFDNRYRYPEWPPLPTPGFLHARGIVATLWVSRTGVAADLAPYARALAAEGLPPTEIRHSSPRRS